MFEYVASHLLLVIQCLMVVSLCGYTLMGVFDLYLRISQGQLIDEYDENSSYEFRLQYFKRPIWNSFWIWALCKLSQIVLIGFMLGLGPLTGFWLTPIFVLGMLFMIYHEARPRFGVWAEQP